MAQERRETVTLTLAPPLVAKLREAASRRYLPLSYYVELLLERALLDEIVRESN